VGLEAGGPGAELMFRRQEEKAHVLAELMDRLGLRPGDRVLDVGSGPGFGSLLAAARVGPTGHVWSLDLSRPALDHLMARCAERGVHWVTPVPADARRFDLPDPSINRFLMLDMLHHAADPEAVIRRAGQVLPPGCRGVVSNYDPSAPGRFGPRPSRRIPEPSVRAWLEAAGFAIESEWRPPDEHYAQVVRRA
jgi:ubiquinone/menaquinone biosynthesis C-methylase UbiE